MAKNRKAPKTELKTRRKNENHQGIRLGRPPLPEEQRKVYIRQPVSLTQDQWDKFLQLVEVLGIHSRSGPNKGLPSWRTFMAILADKAPEIIEQKKKNPSAYRPVLIFPGVSIILHPDSPNPHRSDDEPEKDR